MSVKWVSTNKTGVRYREHPTRKTSNGQVDRYYVIRFRVDGKLKSEATGWTTTDQMNVSKSAAIRAELVENIRQGRRPQSLKEKREMEAELIRQERIQQEEDAAANITFSEAYDYFFSSLKGEGHKKSVDSRYRNHLEPAFGNTPLKEITLVGLEQFRDSKSNLAPKTVHHMLTTMRTVFRYANSRDLYDGKFPHAKELWPKVNNARDRYLTKEEAILLLEALKSKDNTQTHDQAVIALYAGLRASEVLNIQWGDVNFESGTITLPDTKTGEKQFVLMNSIVVDMLRSRMPSEPKRNMYVFPELTGEGVARQFGISDTFKRTVNKLGFNDNVEDKKNRVVFHTLRHTFASWLVMGGTPLYTVQRLMRHKSISQTERYAHLSPDIQREAIETLTQYLQ